MQVPYKYRHKIRQEIYYIKKYGLESHLKKIGLDDCQKYLLSLRGKINYCLQINPQDKTLLEYKNFINKFF